MINGKMINKDLSAELKQQSRKFGHINDNAGHLTGNRVLRKKLGV
jgi:hypothetical protein